MRLAFRPHGPRQHCGARGHSQPPFPPRESGARSVAENIVAPIGATDADNDALTYSLRGADAASFTIQQTAVGELRANAPLDYETKSSYQVDVIATDPTSLNSKATLTITASNDDVAGAITLSSQAPVVGMDLTASITDPDGGVSSIGWT